MLGAMEGGGAHIAIVLFLGEDHEGRHGKWGQEEGREQHQGKIGGNFLPVVLVILQVSTSTRCKGNLQTPAMVESLRRSLSLMLRRRIHWGGVLAKFSRSHQEG